jgi:hypothetical protein
MRGCEGNAINAMTVIENGVAEEWKECPRRPIYDDPRGYSDLFALAGAYERGVLPEDGGLQSQPYRVMRLIRLVEHFRAECFEEKRQQGR